MAKHWFFQFRIDGFQIDSSAIYAWCITTSEEAHSSAVTNRRPDMPLATHSKREMTLSPDGKLLASGNTGAVHLWSVDSLCLHHTFSIPSASVTEVVFSPDGKFLASCSFTNGSGVTVHLRSVDSLSLCHTFATPSNSHSIYLNFSEDGKRFLSSYSIEKTEYVQSVDYSMRLHHTFMPLPRFGRRAFSPDGKLIALHSNTRLSSTGSLGGGSYIISLWSVDSLSLLHEFHGTLPQSRGSNIPYIRFSPDGKFLAFYHDAFLSLLSVDSLSLLLEFTSTLSSDIQFSPDGKLLAFCSHGSLLLWSVDSLSVHHTFKLPSDRNYGTEDCIRFSPDSKHLAIYCLREVTVFQLWPIDVVRFYHSFQGHSNQVTCLEFSPDSTLLVSSSGHETVRIWSIRYKKQSALLRHPCRCERVVWATSAQYTRLATTDIAKVFRIWNVSTSLSDPASVDVTCIWSTPYYNLFAAELDLQGVTDLDSENVRLLKQRGAILGGEVELREDLSSEGVEGEGQCEDENGTSD
ncbi:WD40-repeat-containing domain protein [Kalaharituber pfeilii]|nr:WD40-repeat-containing domain protein [Kalaharituber pfeilii]